MIGPSEGLVQSNGIDAASISQDQEARARLRSGGPSRSSNRRHPAASRPPSAVIADSDAVSRAALRTYLTEASVQVARSVVTGVSCLQAISNCRPAIAIVDLELPDLPGPGIVEECILRYPKTQIIVVTRSKAADMILRALTHGASGYLVKPIDAEGLQAAIGAVVHDETVLCELAVSSVIEAARNGPGRPDTGSQPELTRREQEILQLLAAGLDNAEIAARLVLSRHTVKNHVAHILEKLEVDNRVQAAVHAVREGVA